MLGCLVVFMFLVMDGMYVVSVLLDDGVEAVVFIGRVVHLPHAAVRFDHFVVPFRFVAFPHFVL